jgi:tRNA (guanine37-N1)-methyltransferase
VKRFDILSLFPDYFKGPFDVSMIKRAKENGLLEINLVNIRDFAESRYQQVDDRPYGGGPGMVLMAKPVTQAIRSRKSERSHVIYLTPQGRPLTAQKCAELSEESHLIVLCGHYEGIDERVIESEVDEEISIGDYVLTSGAPAAIVLVDSVSRFIPGVIGNGEATRQDSFENGMFDAPVYTRPPIFERKEVPPVLRRGNHAEIEAWRRKQAKVKTKKVRPELLEQET